MVVRFVPTKVIRARNEENPWCKDQCIHAFGLKQEAHLWWIHDLSRVNWEEFVHCQMRANETYSNGNRQFSVRNRDVLMNAQSPYKWWSTLKSTVFSWNSSLPPLAGGGGGMVCESVGMADLLSDHFDGKQSREFGLLASPIPICPSNASPVPNRPLTCHMSPRLTTFVFRSSEVRRLLLDLDLYDGTDPLGMFALFLKRTTYVLDPRLS